MNFAYSTIIIGQRQGMSTCDKHANESCCCLDAYVLNKNRRKKYIEGEREKRSRCRRRRSKRKINACTWLVLATWRWNYDGGTFCIMIQTSAQLESSPYICLPTHYEIWQICVNNETIRNMHHSELYYVLYTCVYMYIIWIPPMHLNKYHLLLDQ